ncbi:MAG: ABC transporter permease [Clostridiales bacterium]|nr:ABC transporter permease [Clostridiales bacterium]
MKPKTGDRISGQDPPAGKNGILAEKIGIKSILRTPKKALLFLILLATLVTLLTLVMCVHHAVSGYLDECNRYYHTIVELEYMGQEYPDSHAADSSMQASLAENADALQALLELPGVMQFDAEDALLGVIPDQRRKDYQVFDKDAAVIVVYITWWDKSTDSYSALIKNAPYAWGDVLDKITYVSLEEGTLQPGAYYVMCGHFITSANNFLLFQPEDEIVGTGEDALSVPGRQLLSGETLPGDSPYYSLAQVYKNRNNGYRVSPVTDMETLRPWQQGELKLIGGRLFTAEEYAADAQVCVISNILSTVRDLSVGDSIQISLNDCGDLIYSSWFQELAPAKEYRITGIYYRTKEYPDTLFIPRSEPNASVKMTTGYVLGQFRLNNDLAGAFEDTAERLLPAGYKLTVYDEGYGAVAGPYKELKNLSMLFLLICLLVVPGVLALYSYLFISRRREDALLQRALGAGNAHVLRGFLAASLAVTLPAAAIGLTAGRLLEGRVLDYVRVLAERFGAADIRFSSANLFTVRQLEFAPVTDGRVYLLAAVVFLVFVLLFTAAFSVDAMRERKPRRKKKPRAVHGRTSRLSGRLKFAFLSIRRGGMRTLAVVLLCAVITVFLGLLTSASDQYAAQLAEIRDNTVIRGYATDNLGRYRNGMVVPARYARDLIDAGLTDAVYLTWEVSNLRFIGVTRTADGTMRELEDLFVPQGGFAVETLQYKLSREPKWIATNSVAGAPAFYYESEPEITWLEGYGEACLTGADADLCVLPVSMMEEKGIELGDTVRFLCWLEDDDEDKAVGESDDKDRFELLDFLVAGSYVLPYGEETIYTPLGLTLPAGSEPAPLPERAYRPQRYWQGAFDHSWTYRSLHLFTFRSMIFTLSSTAELDLLRDALEGVPFEQVGVNSGVRNYAVIDDADFVSATQGMQRQIRYMNALFGCLYVAVMLIGAVGAYLLQNSRKPEIALMRALGVGPARILVTFLWEQMLLSVLGVAAGGFVWKASGGGANGLFLLLIAVYEFCWMTGSILRILRALKPKAQELLTEPE